MGYGVVGCGVGLWGCWALVLWGGVVGWVCGVGVLGRVMRG